jgi:D-alanine--D-alanine ligase
MEFAMLKKKVAIISGGFSEEHKTSREMGRHVAEALRNLGHVVSVIEYDNNLLDNIKTASPDILFPLVQGKHHGDGAVQALLELIKIPYIGSRPQSAAIINHKTICKMIWRSKGILTPDYFEYSYAEYLNDSFKDFTDRVKANEMSPPVVVKPPTQGSRFGMVFVRNKASFDLMRNSFQYDDTVLVEEYVEGRFYTQGIIEIEGVMTALPPIEIIDGSRDEFKMFPGGSSIRVHDLAPEQTEEITRITITAAALTGASGFARLDYHLNDGKFYLLEINAVPGLIQGYSSMGECAAAAGYNYMDFIAMLLKTAR